jgi:hypothetical protein
VRHHTTAGKAQPARTGTAQINQICVPGLMITVAGVSAPIAGYSLASGTIAGHGV